MMADLFGNNLANNLTEGVAADNILGAGGNDTLNGGDGNDSSYDDSANDSLNSGAGEDFVYGGFGNDALNAVEADIDNGIGDDVYIGEGKDTPNAVEADIDNGIGDDVYIGEGKDTPNTLEADIDNGIGDDVDIFLLNPSGRPTSGPDLLRGSPRPDRILALEGNDTVYGLDGDDRIYGQLGNDRIYGDLGNDGIEGGPGNDLLYAGAGLDTIYGGSGNDTLNAEGSGVDNLFGGMDNDVYIVYTTADILVENPNEGIDIVRSSASYTLDANVENLLLTGTASVNGTGNNLNNQITGNSRNNTLNGGGGNDTLTGGVGSNQFLFNTPLATAGVDRITDFYIHSDTIILDKSVFSALDTRPGNVLAATDFAVINVAATAEVVAAGKNGDEIVYNRRTGNLFYNANNAAVGFGRGGGRFATIVGSPDNLSNTDFRVVR